MSTIAAIATPPGTGALSVIRISGPDTRCVLRACTGRTEDPDARMATLVHVRDGDGHVLDEAIATLYAAPSSFTGEDVAELTCHGGMLVTRRVLERVFACGARPAEPGEFSRRAFENGKLDLTRAEAIADIIRAGSDLALHAAQHQLAGGIYRPVQAAAECLLTAAAHIEAHIDFPEEDISPRSVAQMLAELRSTEANLVRLLGTAERGRLLREGIRVAIIGAPNVGKSSLLNCLLGYERAIVNPAAGTTRDTLEEPLPLSGLPLRIIDTAGLHDSADTLEQAGMQRTLDAAGQANLVLEVQDVSAPPVSIDAFSPACPHILVLNKCDLPEHPAYRGQEGIRISCRTGAGLNELEQAIASVFLSSAGEKAEVTTSAINARHRFAVSQALDSLRAAIAGMSTPAPAPELIAVDLRAALDALGTITGQTDTEAVLDRVFSSFCLGK